MAERQVWINGEMVPESQARVSIFDRGFVYGDAAYDAMGRTTTSRSVSARTSSGSFAASITSGSAR
jgi:hypothetical protein